MAPMCTYRVGGAAARFVDVADTDQLERIARALAAVDLSAHGAAGDVHVVGRGSNLLVADGGLPGLVLRLGEAFEQIDIAVGVPNPLDLASDGPPATDGTVTVTVGGAASLPVVARRTVAAGLVGFEWAVGVPGSIGGAVRMNAGGHGSEMSQVLIRVRVADLLTGDHEWVLAEDLELGYRTSSIAATDVVTSAQLRLVAATPGDAAGETLLKEIVHWRRENQPGGPNAGSVFTNPEGDSAGRLIDQAGCKGLRVGSAAVSDKHANFIQADAGGSADDVRALMMEVVRRVEADSGHRLHPETVMLGFEDRWPERERTPESFR